MNIFQNTNNDQIQIPADYHNINNPRCTDPNHICHNRFSDAEYKTHDVIHKCNKDCDIINPDKFFKVYNILLEYYACQKECDINKNIGGYYIEDCFGLPFDTLLTLKGQLEILIKNNNQKNLKSLSQKLKRIKQITKIFYVSQVSEDQSNYINEHKQYRNKFILDQENNNLLSILNVQITNLMKLDSEKTFNEELFKKANIKIARIEAKIKHNEIIIKYCEILKYILIFEIFTKFIINENSN